MCRNWMWRVGVSVMGLLAVVALQGKSFAQTIVLNGGLVEGLRSAETLLNEADRDYSGYRGKAAGEVHRAIHELVGDRVEAEIKRAEAEHRRAEAESKRENKLAGAENKRAEAETRRAEAEAKRAARKAAAGTTVVVANPTLKEKVRRGEEPQATSDAQLNEARNILLNLQPQIPTTYPKIGAHVSDAIVAINKALAIK